MSAEYMHIGIPILNKKPGMTYAGDGAKFWCSNVDDYDYKIEYLKFEEGTGFPEILNRNWHVAFKVDNLDKYAGEADRILVPAMTLDNGDRLSFVELDGAIIELYEPKK